MSTAVEIIKERLNIVDVVSSYVSLEKSGRQLKARCPFHSEKTPSFYVSPERNSFHCFGCNASGDIFSFVEKIEGVAFIDSLKLLADRAQVDLSQFKKGAGVPDDRSLYEALEYATDFFEGKLQTSADALRYILSRGITQDTIREFRLGYAPDSWHQLETYLGSKGIKTDQAEKAGMIIKKNEGVGFYDRFRDRIMFPITNPSGAIVGFSGRALSTSIEGKTVAKYVNSPETDLYKKSKVLFGYDKAKRAIAEQDRCIVVEGQMDLCMAHQAGTKNVVAVSGTAMTYDHLRLIQRFTNNVVFCLDSDNAGIQALKRSAELAFAMQMEVRVIPLLHSKDPADLILESPDEWLTVTKKSVLLIDFLVALYTKDGLIEEYPKRMTNEIIPLVRVMVNPIEQAVAVRTISEKLRISESAVWSAVKSAPVKKETVSEQVSSKQVHSKERVYVLRDLLLGATRSLPGFQSHIEQKIRSIHDEYEISDLDTDLPEELIVTFASEFEIRYGTENQDLQKVSIDLLLLDYEKECIKMTIQKLMNQIKDTGGSDEHLQRIQDLSIKLKGIKV